MRKAMLLLAAFGLVASLWAAGPFDGTWKVNVNRIQFPQKPEEWVLQNGTYVSSTSVPKVNVKADGTDQPVAGSKDYDTLAVRIVDDKTVEMTNKKGARVVGSSRGVVSADGKTITFDFTIYPESSKQPITGKLTLIRVAAGPSGSHAMSGSWRMQKADASENALTVTYKSSADGLMMSDPVGESYDAKFDGKEYPIQGAAGYTVSLTKVNDRSIDETDRRDGKVVSVSHLTVSADGKTLTVRSEDKVQGTTTTYTATRQ